MNLQVFKPFRITNINEMLSNEKEFNEAQERGVFIEPDVWFVFEVREFWFFKRYYCTDAFRMAGRGMELLEGVEDEAEKHRIIKEEIGPPEFFNLKDRKKIDFSKRMFGKKLFNLLLRACAMFSIHRIRQIEFENMMQDLFHNRIMPDLESKLAEAKKGEEPEHHEDNVVQLRPDDKDNNEPVH